MARGLYTLGFDLIVLPPEFVRAVNASAVVPPEFLIGEPWWDYLLPLAALALGFPVKRLPMTEPLVLHYAHPLRYEQQKWLDNGQRFLECVSKLRSRADCHARALLDEIAVVTGTGAARLDRVSQLVCSSLA